MAETVRKALLWARDYLGRHGIAGAALDAEVLLAHILGQTRVYLYAYGEREISAQEWETYRQVVARRALGTPVAYLTGEKEFMSLGFQVDSRVLIPRPETELLVELALEEAKKYLQEAGSLTLVDVGTGSGAIAVTGAKLLPASRFYALDISPEALEVARANARRMGVEQRITFFQGDLLAPLANRGLEGKIDMILANLPYIPSMDIPELQQDVRLYEPVLALDGGRDGLELYRRLIPQAALYLRPGGALLMEIGMDQGQSARDLLNSPLWGNTKVVQDYAGRDRIVFSRKGGVTR